MAEHRDHQANDTNDHDNALHEIGERGCNVAARNEVYRSQASDQKHPDPFLHIREDRAEKRTEPLINGSRVGNEKYENDHGRKNLEPFGIIALFEKFRHRLRSEPLRHFSCTVSEEKPGEQASENRVTNADPDASNTDVPSVLARIANENNGREIGRAVGKGGHPRADLSSTDQKAVERF